MYTVCHDRDNLWFCVTEFDRPHEGIIGGQYRVHLRNRTCHFGRFDALRYPCAHVIAACQNLCLNPMSYVDEVYKIKTMYNVWRHIFPPIPDERKWLPVLLTPFKLLSDRELRRKLKGRPCSTRIRTNMDIWEITNQQKLCGCQNHCHMGVVDGFVLDSSLDQLSTEVVVSPVGDLVVGVGRVTHLDRIMTVAVFASPMAEVFESLKVMEIGRKKSSLMVRRAIPHATTAYRLAVDSE
ncbi:hypothetical protein GOBAR_AA24817 [Gossypium barbadense]|uniref:Zinc finger PMZ-type domain-containing protein n=1 Tax=Gossypium barbadense TaxID=3634 RepID=A0A2P5WXM0_GOSBA|nr:hypothetical protein GOBAR_AA24817 [Gossypium barbadense]